MDYAMRFDRWYRFGAALLRMGPSATLIRLTDDRLTVRQGRRFAIDVPRTAIASARAIPDGTGIGWGVRRSGDAWVVTGSRRGIVEVRLNRGVRPDRIPSGDSWFNTAIRQVYLSLEDPTGFVAALQDRPAATPGD